MDVQPFAEARGENGLLTLDGLLARPYHGNIWMGRDDSCPCLLNQENTERSSKGESDEAAHIQADAVRRHAGRAGRGVRSLRRGNGRTRRLRTGHAESHVL